MGVTIHYRGRLDDIGRVEDFEDRILDFALAFGASARIWRSVSGQFPDRFVRGLIVDLAPGQEPTSLLISPEGWLINLHEIEAAEQAPLPEPTWCFVKTQFGPLPAHIALVELLDAIRREFMTNLEVNDEGGYWENRDPGELTGKIHFVSSAIDAMAAELNEFGLSDEAAEDPEILTTRIERVARLVHRTIGRPSEHPPVEFDDSDAWTWTDESEAKWDASYREQRRKQERLHRAIEERLAAGEDYETAFLSSMRDEGRIDLPGEEANEDEEDFLTSDAEQEPDEPWRQSVADYESVAESESDATEGDSFMRKQHPLQQRAFELMSRLHDLLQDVDASASNQAQVLLGGAGDMMGGLAQALGRLGDEDDEFSSDPTHRGLAIVQLKRALRGAAFAGGALFALAQEGVFDDQVFNELRETVDTLRDDTFSQLQHFRGRSGAE